MTRQEIEADYAVTSGVITSPGKFEGEPVYAPYFYDLLGKGEADNVRDSEGVDVFTFFIQDPDTREFSELRDADSVDLWENGDGFVHVELF